MAKYTANLILIALTLVLFSCNTTSKVSEDRALIHLQLGVNFLEQQNYPMALKELLSAEENDPDNPLVQNNLGMLYFMREKYELSIKHFSRAYQIKKDYTDAKNNLARVYIEIKQYATAQKLLNEVLDDLTYLTPNKAYMNYGLLEFNRGRFVDAKKHFKKVLETERENCFAQTYLGRSFLELKEIKQATDQLEKATTFCKPLGIDDAHYFSAISLYRAKQKDLSLIRFQEVLSLFPEGKYREQSKKMIQLINKGTL